MKIGINGTGRIGRCIIRALFADVDYQHCRLIAINSTMKPEDLAHLLRYDSVHGKFGGKIEVVDSGLLINGFHVNITCERDVKSIRWSDVDVVMECSGVFNSKEKASIHVTNGAKKVIISAPSTDAIKTIVYGVNHQDLMASDDVISIGSCTTNCLAPIAKLVNDKFGIISGFITTVHSYTNDQNILDGSHSKDLRRARAGAVSMVPTSTGAAKTIGLIIPELNGRLDGSAIRVPTPNVSLIDCAFVVSRNIEKSEVLDSIKNSSFNSRTLSSTEEHLVSVDFVQNPSSCVVDLSETKVVANNLLRIVAWYDNEWAFSLRMIDVAGLWF